MPEFGVSGSPSIKCMSLAESDEGHPAQFIMNTHDDSDGPHGVEESQRETSGFNPILWVVAVHRLDPKAGRESCMKTYVSSSPPSTRFSRWGSNGVRRQTPHDCIFKVACNARCELSQFDSSQFDGSQFGGFIYDSPGARPNYLQSHLRRALNLLPDKIKDIPITDTSTNFIIIQSPALRRRLESLAGYYPAFFEPHDYKLEKPMTDEKDEEDDSIAFAESWGFLLHRIPAMEAFLQNDNNDSLNEVGSDLDQELLAQEREHTQCLYDYLKPCYDKLVPPCLKLLEQCPPRISFEMLWYIFSPGTDVYVRNGTTWHVYVVYRSNPVSDIAPFLGDETLGRSKIDYSLPSERDWDFHLWYLDTDGRVMGRVQKIVTVQPFNGLRDVISLQICPVALWDKHDGGERRRKIMQRSMILNKSFQQGHLLARYHGPCQGGLSQYTGTLVADQRRGLNKLAHLTNPPELDFGLDGPQLRFKNYDSIILNDSNDFNEFLEVHSDSDSSGSGYYRARYKRSSMTPRSRVPQGSGSKRTSAKKETDRREISDHHLLLMFPRVCAFVLNTKQWLLIEPDYMTEVTQSDESITNLVLDDASLRIIRTLAARQDSKRETWAADSIEGKGTGQILLLHGPPGTGKTYTVEAIAEFLNRPLLALTVADIGTIETRVEKELFKWFSLAEAWDAVLLVDEADIFLERRQNRDLLRNGLVSAFLRRMEYFKGLLFLTTNRVGQIDDAFISRVHAAIGYRSFTPEDRAKIWQGFFHKLERERAGKIQVARGAKKWVLEKAASGGAQLNGRDIRNALQTAITLAEAEYEEDPDFDPEKTTIVVDQSHFERVLEISEKFHSYLQSIKKEDERKRAANRFDRNDYHGVSFG